MERATAKYVVGTDPAHEPIRTIFFGRRCRLTRRPNADIDPRHGSAKRRSKNGHEGAANKKTRAHCERPLLRLNTKWSLHSSRLLTMPSSRRGIVLQPPGMWEGADAEDRLIRPRFCLRTQINIYSRKGWFKATAARASSTYRTLNDTHKVAARRSLVARRSRLIFQKI